MLEVDQYGFDEVDRRLLLTIIEKYGRAGGREYAGCECWPKNPTRSKRSTNLS